MKSNFPAVSAVLIQLELTLAFCVHVDFIPVCNVILVLTN